MDDNVFEALARLLGQLCVEADGSGSMIAASPFGFHALEEEPLHFHAHERSPFCDERWLVAECQAPSVDGEGGRGYGWGHDISPYYQTRVFEIDDDRRRSGFGRRGGSVAGSGGRGREEKNSGGVAALFCA